MNGHGATRVLNLQPWENRGLLLQLPLILEQKSGLHHAQLVCPLVLPAFSSGDVDKNALVLLSVLLAWSCAWSWHSS